ncbi:hypothetical protein FF011L_36720 [Roseimaritima multifibrata]|uniref:Uncharacterized protein n=1 Tax=Roseimaritima multifibrata TaxID=1930274 RepID=A0A517MJ69_9BACT|nr:hypothetical protein [Roseimaritima multifibrata]QDS94890.1 hypothetical protein FF011L_36720 [Roseimaritima multifibrata]
MFDRENFARRLTQGKPAKESIEDLEERVDSMFVDAWADHQTDKEAEIERESQKQSAIRRRTDELCQESGPSAKRTQTGKAKAGSKSSSSNSKKLLLMAAMVEHHKYRKRSKGSEDSVGEWRPIGSNELARNAKVSKDTASRFFNKHWDNHGNYKVHCQRETLLPFLRQFAGEPIISQHRPLHHNT